VLVLACAAASGARAGERRSRDKRCSERLDHIRAPASARSRRSHPGVAQDLIPRGIGALGYTIERPTEDRFLLTREELENKMAVLFGGRASEQLVFGRVSTAMRTILRR